MKKRLIALIVAIAVVLAALATVLIVRAVRNRRPPELSALTPRIKALVEGSFAVNDVLFGAGLQTYPRVYEDEYATSYDETHKIYYYTFTDVTHGTVTAYQYCVKQTTGEGTVWVDIQNGNAPLSADHRTLYRYAYRTESPEVGKTYIFKGETYYYYQLPDYVETRPEHFYTRDDDATYDYVRTDSGYLSVEDIKNAAEQIYAKSYLEAVYVSQFTGHTVSSWGVRPALYRDFTDSNGNTWLQRYNVESEWNASLERRIYDYDTMKMVRPSNASYVNIEVETYLASDPANRQVVRLSLALQDGDWYLDSPTY